AARSAGGAVPLLPASPPGRQHPRLHLLALPSREMGRRAGPLSPPPGGRLPRSRAVRVVRRRRGDEQPRRL
ncbi:MAG: hypothetical protein AVDCRST_MAG65-982, partial [uncultured Solirubrobacteraceae bacterium]